MRIDAARKVPYRSLLEGEPVDKVGQFTGWTGGIVTHTCYDIQIPNTTYTYLCQTVSDMHVEGGDSGGPVFTYTDPIARRLMLEGIVTARGNIDGVWHAIFSPFQNIHEDLRLTESYYSGLVVTP